MGVFVPINELEGLTAKLKENKVLRKTSKKTAVLNSIKKGMMQVAQIEKGEIKGISLQQFFD